MSLKSKLLLGLLGINLAFAASNSQINKNLSDLNSQINQINQDLGSKKKQQKNISKAISDSSVAITKSESLLAQLKAKLNLDLKELERIKSLLPQIITATDMAKTYTVSAIHRIYQQINLMKNESGVFLLGNDSLQNSRKKAYLTSLLQIEQKKYQDLQAQLTQLDALNVKLESEVARLTGQVSDMTAKHARLIANKQKTVSQSQELTQQISSEQQQLSNLKQKQAELNRLMAQIAQNEKDARNKMQASAGSSSPSKSSSNLSYEDSSDFASRHLAKPVNAPVTVNFGDMRNSTRNNGILFAANDNAPVYSISNGKVMYAGDLPGFGKVVVIDHGDNYMSVYGGVISSVQKGQKVLSGAQIASAGTSANQPMGGVYFELRHLGKPVDPTLLMH